MNNFSAKNLYEAFESIVISLLVITFVIVFIFRAVTVDGDSMLPNLHNGDKLITTNFFYKPKKGDIVVIDKNNELGKPLIKRVIATEGDTVLIDYTTGNVYVNNKMLEENYIQEKIYPSNENSLKMTIKTGHIFLLGDNRNNSRDSRDSIIGQVSENNILGKALLRIYPISDIGVL